MLRAEAPARAPREGEGRGSDPTHPGRSPSSVSIRYPDPLCLLPFPLEMLLYAGAPLCLRCHACLYLMPLFTRPTMAAMVLLPTLLPSVPPSPRAATHLPRAKLLLMFLIISKSRVPSCRGEFRLRFLHRLWISDVSESSDFLLASACFSSLVFFEIINISVFYLSSYFCSCPVFCISQIDSALGSWEPGVPVSRSSPGNSETHKREEEISHPATLIVPNTYSQNLISRNMCRM